MAHYRNSSEIPLILVGTQGKISIEVLLHTLIILGNNFLDVKMTNGDIKIKNR